MHHIHNFLFTFIKPICLTVSEPLIVVNKPRLSFVRQKGAELGVVPHEEWNIPSL